MNKPIISETRKELSDILDRFGLERDVHRAIILQGNKMCLTQGSRADAFVFLKFDELVTIIDDSRKVNTTDAELKKLIQDWIKRERQKGKAMYKGQNSDFAAHLGRYDEVVMDTNKS